MNILFVMEYRGDAGNTHAIANYTRVGAAFGHTIAICGPALPDATGVRFSTDFRAFDRVIYSFESKLYQTSRLQEVALLARFPREQRFILDSDGMYNPLVIVDGYDRNFLNADQRTVWLRHYDALSDRVLQPTLRPPTDSRVTSLPFYGFNPALVQDPATAPPKQFDVMYVGHNWWRWKETAGEILPGLAQIRDQIDKIGFVGRWWDRTPEWAWKIGLEAAYQVDQRVFQQFRISTTSAVPYGEVIQTMSTARVNIFTQRPLLKHLRYLTLKYFEVFCADTIPLLMLEPDHAEAVYGPGGRELTLTGRVAEKVLDALRRPDYYRQVVVDVRRYLLAHHTYGQRVEELVAALSA
ncbi:MAG: hypothetical protein K8T89_18780 [Planctomycetes bacterium]|nr:hypothetical protein [Planctomycetota bacterium]